MIPHFVFEIVILTTFFNNYGTHSQRWKKRPPAPPPRVLILVFHAFIKGVKGAVLGNFDICAHF